MGSFLRWMVLAWCLIDVCQSQLSNLRPLKGRLNDIDGPRSATDGGKEQSIRQGSSSLMEASLIEGVAASVEQQNQLNNNPSLVLELSSQFLSAFKRAEKEAEEASCVGRALIEATKAYAYRLGLPVSIAVEILMAMEVDQDMCWNILNNEGCEDFKKPTECSNTDIYRHIDGSCNNLDNPIWGMSMAPFVRLLYPAYENGFDSLRGAGREGASRLPSPRTVSANLQTITKFPDLLDISGMLWQWGQFIDHDMTFTAETQIQKVKDGSSNVSPSTNPSQLTCPIDADGEVVEMEPVICCPEGNPEHDLDLPDCRPIDVSQDPLFIAERRSCMRFVRSLIASKGCELGPREQGNQNTAYLDGSAIYGSTEQVAQVLRTNQGGFLQKTEEGNLLPRHCCLDQTFHCFKGGDLRVNEQPGLTSMHTLWLRVHNQLATDFASENPHWDDETLYQEARRVVIAFIQQTTYREFLPLVLGTQAMYEEDLNLLPNGPGLTYNPFEDATLANVFSTAAFRFGHTLVTGDLTAGEATFPLEGNFENATLLFQGITTPSALLMGLASSQSPAPDFHLDETLVNRLFISPGSNVGLDLMSLNIQRGRDHGLPGYTSWRRGCNLPTFASFGELSSVMPSEVAQIFSNIYSDVDEIDLFPAALSEFSVDGGLVGPTFACIISLQFSRLKKGDRFFFQNLEQPKPFTPEQLYSISELNLASIICQHSDIQFLQPYVLFTAGYWNPLQSCSSYPTLDTSLWKEEEEPQCYGVGIWEKFLDDWCTTNCFLVPPYCPPTYCSCEPKEANTIPHCYGVGDWEIILDDWCTTNCLHDPPFCPATHCYCE